MQDKLRILSLTYQNLASVKLTVVIFIAIAAGSIIGTLLPQGITPQEIEAHYRPAAAWIINTFGLNDLYRSSWFRALLLLLCANLIVCTIERLPKTIRLLQRREESIDPQKLVKFSISRQFSTRLPWDETRSRLTKAISEGFGPLRLADGPDACTGIAEKGRWSPFMVYVAHASVLVILIGALVGSLFGFKGSMELNEGGSSDRVTLANSDRTVTLPFQVRCDKFEVSYYDTGAPQEFRSDLAIVKDGREVVRESIRVNDPLTYDGVTFYQSSYGTNIRQAEVEVQDRDTGKNYTLTLPFREDVTIPGTPYSLRIVAYQANLMRVGPALGMILSREGEDVKDSWVLVQRPAFHGNRLLNFQLKVIRTDEVRFTGLQVKEDPGIWLVWLGFTAMLVGIGMTFYTSHRKVWVWAALPSSGKGASRVIVAGRASKNAYAFEQEFNSLCDRLQDELKSGDTRK